MDFTHNTTDNVCVCKCQKKSVFFFNSHFIISLKSYDMVATTFLYTHSNYFVLRKKTLQFNVKFWREVGPNQKNETYSGDFSLFTNIIEQVVDF
ncbi:unnamed protein product [Tenebrio molitor]|nr:unnamed protein product [Tenebrio molitor]